MSINKKFGENVRHLRKLRNISQEKLSFLSKIHRTYISEIERGKANITLEHIEKLAISLGVDLSDLLK